MGKRYYCDYCDRSFPDTANNRKKHITGVLHQRQKKLHYDSFRDAETILAEDRGKKPCRRFQETGSCNFGSVCRFSHLSPETIHFLERNANFDRTRKKHKLEASIPVVDDCILNSWIEKVSKTQDTAQIEPRMNEIAEITESWKLPAELELIPDLPPSLFPPTFAEIVQSESTSDWG